MLPRHYIALLVLVLPAFFSVIAFYFGIIREIRRRPGYDPRIAPMDFDAMFDALLAGEAGIIAACITISDKRKRSYAFTVPYYRGGVSAMVAAD